MKQMVRFVTQVTVLKKIDDAAIKEEEVNADLTKIKSYLFGNGFEVKNCADRFEAYSCEVPGQQVKEWFMAQRIDSRMFLIRVDYSRMWGMM